MKVWTRRIENCNRSCIDGRDKYSKESEKNSTGEISKEFEIWDRRRKFQERGNDSYNHKGLLPSGFEMRNSVGTGEGKVEKH